MNVKRLFPFCLFSLLAAGSTVGDNPHVVSTTSAPAGARAVVIAALPFRSASQDAQYEPLAENMGDMVASFLCRSGQVTFVERQRLDEVLKEHELTLKALVEAKTRAKVGRLLGARYILTGAVTVLNRHLRINAHLFEVETARVARSRSAEGKIEHLLKVVEALARKLAGGLDLELPELKEEEIDRHPEANLYFMRGLGYYYGNMGNHAIAEFMKALALKPDHARARYWNGMCYFHGREYRHARIEFKRFLEGFPEHDLTAKAKERLKTCNTEIERQETSDDD